MSTVVFLLVLFVSFIIGVFGWAQIVGSLQTIRERGPKMLITIAIWVIILGGSYLIVNRFFSENLLAWIIAMIVSFVMILGSGKMH